MADVLLMVFVLYIQQHGQRVMIISFVIKM